MSFSWPSQQIYSYYDCRLEVPHHYSVVNIINKNLYSVELHIISCRYNSNRKERSICKNGNRPIFEFLKEIYKYIYIKMQNETVNLSMTYLVHLRSHSIVSDEEFYTVFLPQTTQVDGYGFLKRSYTALSERACSIWVHE
jgi:hypothetical protein